ESLRGRPERTYVAGVLHPAFSAPDPEEGDEAMTAESEDEAPDAFPAYGGMKQSAIGLSFTTSSTAGLRIDVEFGEYMRPDSGVADDEDNEAEDQPAPGSKPTAEVKVLEEVPRDPVSAAAAPAGESSTRLRGGWKRQ